MLDQNIKPADQPRPSTSHHDSDTDNASGGNLPEKKCDSEEINKLWSW